MVSNNVISYAKPKSIASEAYRALRTNLEFAMARENEKVILVTSSHVGEGKSSVAANLATVFAMQNKNTILIDADMRRGVQYKNFNVSNKNGLSNYLAKSSIDPKKFIKKTEVPNLSLITCGAIPPNPAELLSLNVMKELLKSLREDYDIIVIDAAPVIPVTDSVILSSLVDKIIAVVSAGETHKEELKVLKNTIENAGAKIDGIVLNKIEMKKNSYGKYNKYGKGYYGSYYKYDSDEKDENN